VDEPYVLAKCVLNTLKSYVTSFIEPFRWLRTLLFAPVATDLGHYDVDLSTITSGDRRREARLRGAALCLADRLVGEQSLRHVTWV
jgi:hypothetical protein